MNKYPLWKNLLLLLSVVLATIYAAPNLYPPDPAIQISHDSGVVDQRALDQATSALDADGIPWLTTEMNNGVALIRLERQDDQSRAQQLINLTLPRDYVVALNLAPNTPDWLLALGATPMTFGLDLQGGVYFLMEVDMEEAVTKQLTDAVSGMRSILRDERIRYRSPIRVDAQNRLVLRFADAESRSAANAAIRAQYPDFEFRNAQEGSEYLLYFTMAPLEVQELQDFAVKQNLTTLRSRMDELGVREPKIQQVGGNRISVELPGIQDTARAKDMISAVATLQFHLVAEPGAPAGTWIEHEYEGALVRLSEDIIVGGENVTGAQTSIDPETTLPQVNIELDAAGARRMNQVTRVNVGKQMAILLSETKTRSVTVEGPDGTLLTSSEPVVEERLISVATIQSALGRQFRITGLQGNEARDLALMIRSGALAAPMYFLEESTIGPSMGQENISNGVKSVLIGLIWLVVFMVAWYKVSGLVAVIALCVNLLLLVALMSIVGWTLTMPGIAGIVLTLGMAVDANVLIYARIREEIRNGMSVPRAIDTGFSRAFVTIVDANLTTLIVSVVLFSIGTGPVKGFAVTLTLGILTSVFTAVWITRAMINLLYGGSQTRRISIGWGVKDETPRTSQPG